MGTVAVATRRIRRQMRRHAAVQLTVPQFRAMRYVQRNPGTSLAPLAEHLGVSTSSGSALVERLVRAGMLDRAGDPEERRRIRLDLTASGTAMVVRGQVGTRRWLAAELAALQTHEREALSASLRLLSRIGVDDETDTR